MTEDIIIIGILPAILAVGGWFLAFFQRRSAERETARDSEILAARNREPEVDNQSPPEAALRTKTDSDSLTNASKLVKAYMERVALYSAPSAVADIFKGGSARFVGTETDKAIAAIERMRKMREMNPAYMPPMVILLDPSGNPLVKATAGLPVFPWDEPSENVPVPGPAANS